MRKIFTLLVMLCAISGGAVAQKLVTTAEAGKYYTLECNSTSHSGFLGETPNGLNGQSAKPTYLKFEQTDGGFYVKSALTGKYLNKGEIYDEAKQKYQVAYSSTASTVWTIGKLSDDATDIYLTIGESKVYLNNNYTGEEKLHIMYHDNITDQNACSLWEMREHEDGYKVIETIGGNITDVNQLVDGGYVILKNVGKQKYIYEGTHDHKLYMGTAATEGAGHEYIFRVRKEGEKYAFMAVSGRYFSSPLDGKDVITCGIDNSAKDEFTIESHPTYDGKWRVKSSNIDKWWDAQDSRFVGWKGTDGNSQYEIIPVDVKNLEHDLADYITVDENIVKWVNIKNLRSGNYATYEGESTKMSLKSDKGCSKAFFYLTGTLGAEMSTVKIYNYATANLCAETNSWTAAGTNWNIIASQGQGHHPGWAITKDTNLGGTGSGKAWNNEGGNGTAIATWNGNDQGSTWAFELGDFYTLYAKIEGLKGELRTVVDAAQTSYKDGDVALNPVTLSATEGQDGYLYSNAAGANNNYDGDDLGVGALIDGKDDTFMHSNYVSNSDDGLDHYIRVDMGEGKTIDYFTFGYQVRKNQGGGNAPKTIVVSGSNDNDKYYEITTLTNIPGGNGYVYASEPMGGKPYRYLRFMVTETQNNNKNNNHPYFALASFNLNRVTVKEGSAVKTLLYNTLSHRIDEAEALLGSFRGTEDEINALKNLLPTVVAGLEVHEYPFELTKNVNDPICYFIKSARSKEWSGNYYWTFESGKVTTIVANDEYKKDVEAYWFFMENPQNGQLQLVPYIEHLKPMGYTTVANGNNKLTNNATASGFVGTAYTFVTNAEGDWGSYPYALRPYGLDNYVSNCNGSDGYFMGFWNDLNDYGTRFNLERAEVTPSAYLRDLRTALEACPNVDENLVKDEPGYYSVEGYELYETIVNGGYAVYNDATSTDEEVYLQLVIFDNDPRTALEINMPEAGKFYRIKNNGGTGYLNGNGTSGLVKFDSDNSSANSIFYYVNKNDNKKLLSYATGFYLGLSDSKDFVHYTTTVGEAAGTTFEFSATPTVSGKLLIGFRNAERSLHSEGQSSNAASAGQTGDPYRFTVEEVTTLPVNVSSVGVATLYTPVALKIPADVTVYTAVQDEDENGAYLKLQLVGTGYIPANTGVILEADPGTYDFNITDEAVEEFSSEENVLTGKCETSNMGEGVKVYTLQKPKDKDLGFYLFKGTTTITGFRSWLELPKDSPVLSFRFKFGTTTDIESLVTLQNAKAIYDLSGRRVENMDKGIYIVNGKKIVVK